VDRRAAQSRHLEREKSIVDKLAERREARREEAARRREQAELDELARLGWWRGAR
jgi:flagellar biosynthesis chaperone FliJ